MTGAVCAKIRIGKSNLQLAVNRNYVSTQLKGGGRSAATARKKVEAEQYKPVAYMHKQTGEAERCMPGHF
ncbi:hypothetical protein [Flavisolibacter nicotianae]|uniref:hypothetical protein n=1 Tax=Flavisolibacter nicotianae TaxID=2364882 RepID=UPI000EAEC5D4|nr:hypothetical protein [Flavisolibacter nicotianae]